MTWILIRWDLMYFILLNFNPKVKFDLNDEQLKQQCITNAKLTIDDFEILKVVGKGSYGKVLLVTKNDDDQVLAMKVLKKNHMSKRNQIEHIKTERKIMVSPNNNR